MRVNNWVQDRVKVECGTCPIFRWKMSTSNYVDHRDFCIITCYKDLNLDDHQTSSPYRFYRKPPMALSHSDLSPSILFGEYEGPLSSEFILPPFIPRDESFIPTESTCGEEPDDTGESTFGWRIGRFQRRARVYVCPTCSMNQK